MWPESSPVYAVNLVEKSAIMPEIQNFSIGDYYFWRSLYDMSVETDIVNKTRKFKVPSHHDVLASARLAFNKFHKKNAKRSNLQRSPNVHMAIGVSPALTNAWETF